MWPADDGGRQLCWGPRCAAVAWTTAASPGRTALARRGALPCASRTTSPGPLGKPNLDHVSS
ncbi:hypothetical protein HPB47_011311, partial [Ixodes persulcatus]